MKDPASRSKEHAGEILLQFDERKRVIDATQPPFRWICSLEVLFPEPVIYALGTLEQPGKYWGDIQPTIQGCGTGLLISPNHVLTAAHVLTGLKPVNDRKTGNRRFRVVCARQVNVIPGRNDTNNRNLRPFGTFSSRQLHICPEFAMGMELELSLMKTTHIKNMLPYDYGVVDVLPQRLPHAFPGEKANWWGRQRGFFVMPVETTLKAQIKRAKVNIAGYPGEKGVTACSTLWHSFDRVIDVFPELNGKVLDLILYQADTSEGMSGSPVWIKCKDGRRYLAGVHSSFINYTNNSVERKLTANVAALITRDVIAQLRRWGVRCAN